MNTLDEQLGSSLRTELHSRQVGYDPSHAQDLIDNAMQAATGTHRRRRGRRWALPALAATVAVLVIAAITVTISSAGHHAVNPATAEPPSIARLSPRVLLLLQRFLAQNSNQENSVSSIAFVFTTVATAERDAEDSIPIPQNSAQRQAAAASAILIVGHGSFEQIAGGGRLHGTVATEVARLDDGSITDTSLGRGAVHLSRFGHVHHIPVAALAASAPSTFAGYRSCEIPSARPAFANGCQPDGTPKFTIRATVDGTSAGSGPIPVRIGQPVTIAVSVSSHAKLGNLYLLINSYPWGMKAHQPDGQAKILLHHGSTLRSGQTITTTWTATDLFDTRDVGVSVLFDIGNATAGVTPAKLALGQ